MLNQQTKEKLSWMHMATFVREYSRQMEDPSCAQLTFDERFGMLVDAEYTSRQNKSLQNLLKKAKLRQQACLEDIDYAPDRLLNRDQLRQLSTGLWIREKQNLILTGATGTGKSYLACAFGNMACRQGIKTRYFRVPRLLTDLSIARGDGSYNKLMTELKKNDLLILDDWGLNTLDPLACRDLLEVVEDRYEERSTLIASQLPVSSWYEIFQDSTIADAILDRLVHAAYRIELSGASRRAAKQETGGVALA